MKRQVIMCLLFASIVYVSSRSAGEVDKNVWSDLNCRAEVIRRGHAIKSCAYYQCSGIFPNIQMYYVLCPEPICKKRIGYKEEDTSKPFPECCGGPLCDPDEISSSSQP